MSTKAVGEADDILVTDITMTLDSNDGVQRPVYTCPVVITKVMGSNHFTCSTSFMPEFSAFCSKYGRSPQSAMIQGIQLKRALLFFAYLHIVQSTVYIAASHLTLNLASAAGVQPSSWLLQCRLPCFCVHLL